MSCLTDKEAERTDGEVGTATRGASNLVKIVTGHAATSVVLILSGLVIPRVLGVANYGRFAAVLAVVAILVAASSCGLHSVEVRYLAPMWRGQDRSGLVKLASSVWAARLITGAVSGVVAFIWLIGSTKLGLDFGLCLMLGLFCFLRCAYEATSSLMLPAGHAGKMSGFELVRASLTLLVVTGLFWWFDLNAVFAGLVILSALLALAAIVVMLRILPLQIRQFRWSVLRPYLGYSSSAFVGMLSGILYVQLSIYVVATCVAPLEAGLLAVAMNLYALARSFFLAARRALLPLLGEMEARGEIERIRHWGSLIMRYGTAAACLMAVSWAFIGQSLIRWCLTEAFLPVYPCVAVILVSGIFFCCAASCNGLLFIRNRAGIAAGNLVIHTAIFVAGLFLVIRAEGPGTALRICGVYVGATALFGVCAYMSLARWGGIQLPLRRTMLLIVPATMVWPVLTWESSLVLHWAGLAIFLLLYWGFATLFKLLPVDEVRRLLYLARRSVQGGESTAMAGR